MLEKYINKLFHDLFEEEIGEETYVISASPITELLWNNFYETGKEIDYLLVNPIIKRDTIVGYVETITKKKICSSEYWTYVTEDYPRGDMTRQTNYDEVGKSHTAGNVDWKICYEVLADPIYKTDEIVNYYKQTPEEVLTRIDNIREECKKYALTNSVEEANKKIKR